jgi:hypothetical protein
MLLSQNAVSSWMSALALASVLAAPAAATVRTATFTWAPATGPVAGYQLYTTVDGGVESAYSYVSQPRAVISMNSAASVTVVVAAFDAAGRLGPRSNASPPLRLCPGDFDGDELIETSDVNSARSCVLKAATGACAGADMNNDGSVAVGDFLALEVGADACPNAGPDTCGGDMDGDGWISDADVQAMRVCIGLRALGNCVAADFDGNGFVSVSDVGDANRAVGRCTD